MIVSYIHGRKILRVPIAPLIALLTEERDAYKAEAEMLIAELQRTRDELRELRWTVLARMKADAKVAALYRERDVARARAAERDPNAMLN
jgi:hypothetical protein